PPYLVRPRPAPILSPYTTLFRSVEAEAGAERLRSACADEPRNTEDLTLVQDKSSRLRLLRSFQVAYFEDRPTDSMLLTRVDLARSEEHTSELQSRESLVCRVQLD